MEAENPIKSVETTLQIIETLKHLEGATVTELANELDCTKGTVHNHLATLASRGFVVQRDDEYRLGIILFGYGQHIREEYDRIYDLAVPELEKLAERTGELANLFVEEHGQGIYLHRTAGEQALSLDTGVGTIVDLHNTALGKAILAHMSSERVDKIIDRHGLTETTPNTLTSRKALYENLETIHERGVAFDCEERVIGVQCIAAPIVTKDGRVLGSISVAGPTSRMNLEDGAPELNELVANTADVISINATYE